MSAMVRLKGAELNGRQCTQRSLLQLIRYVPDCRRHVRYLHRGSRPLPMRCPVLTYDIYEVSGIDVGRAATRLSQPYHIHHPVLRLSAARISSRAGTLDLMRSCCPVLTQHVRLQLTRRCPVLTQFLFLPARKPRRSVLRLPARH
eukprot:3053254-Rhodomonas_salina.2